MSYIYLLPIILALCLGLVYIGLSRVKEKKMIDKPFLSDISNELYVLSFSTPFHWFVNPNEEDEKVRDMKKLIREANESHRLNYRVYATIQIILLILAIIGLIIFSMLADNIILIVQFLFNIQVNTTDPSSLTQIKIGVGIVLMSFSVIPKFYLKSKAKKIKFRFIKDLPILQLFILLMLKAKRPLNDVIYILSTTKTIYRPIFDTAYRIYVRDKHEGMNYLLESFMDTKFEETILVLMEYGEYSRQETLTVLDNGLKDITEYTNTLKRRKDIGGNVLSQLSLALPFLSAMLLIFAPIVSYGMGLMNF